MEGLNNLVGAFVLVYLGVLIFGISALVALGLWIFGGRLGARVLFATGLFCGAVIVDIAFVWLVSADQGSTWLPTVVIALGLFLAGAGQFIAAGRGPRIYAGAFGLAVSSFFFLAAPLLGAGVSARQIPAGLSGQFGLLALVIGFFLAAASLLIAVSLPVDKSVPKG